MNRKSPATGTKRPTIIDDDTIVLQMIRDVDGSLRPVDGPTRWRHFGADYEDVDQITITMDRLGDLNGWGLYTGLWRYCVIYVGEAEPRRSCLIAVTEGGAA